MLLAPLTRFLLSVLHSGGSSSSSPTHTSTGHSAPPLVSGGSQEQAPKPLFCWLWPPFCISLRASDLA
jgi:hypothetical protein